MRERTSLGLVVVDIVESVCRLLTICGNAISWIVSWMALVICASLLFKGTSQMPPSAVWVFKWIPPAGIIIMALNIVLGYGGLGKALRKLFKGKEDVQDGS